MDADNPLSTDNGVLARWMSPSSNRAYAPPDEDLAFNIFHLCLWVPILFARKDMC